VGNGRNTHFWLDWWTGRGHSMPDPHACLRNATCIRYQFMMRVSWVGLKESGGSASAVNWVWSRGWNGTTYTRRCMLAKIFPSRVTRGLYPTLGELSKGLSLPLFF
jgi:hypothetical protein